MLAALSNIDVLTDIYGKCMSRDAASALYLAVRNETDALSAELEAVLARWSEALPLFELRDVDFDKWINCTFAWERKLTKADAGAPDGIDDGNARLFERLRSALVSLNGIDCAIIPDKMFSNLAFTSGESYCYSQKTECIAQIGNWIGLWPKEMHQKNARRKRERLIEQVGGSPYSAELAEFVNINAPDLNISRSASFGKFIFKNRRKFLLSEFRSLYSSCFLIELIDNTLLCSDLDDAAVGDQYSEPEDAAQAEWKMSVLEKIDALTDMAQWRKITAQDVKDALRKALQMNGERLPDIRLRDMSNTLWSLFGKRRGCDPDMSFKATWLNIVGYFIKKGYLYGPSPVICQLFFPGSVKSDYNFINKGRTGESKTFQVVVPLLDCCF